MISSMTAFGRTEKEIPGYRLTLEIRTLNSRYLDTILRFPKNFLELEEVARKKVSQSLRRGRVEVFAQLETLQTGETLPRINIEAARSYWEQLQNLHDSLPGSDVPKLDHLLGIPYLFESGTPEENRDAVKELLMAGLEEALQKVQQMRAQEGEALLGDILQRVGTLQQELSGIEARKDAFLSEYQQRLRDRIQELMGEAEVDEQRIAQEMVLFAERSDITEEIVRLRSHFDQLQSLCRGAEPAEGRTLDFITQEMHREVNTIGCKSSDLEIIQAIVRMKSEIGRLREQVQNIE